MEWNFKGLGLFFKALLKDYIAKVKFVLILSFKTSQPWRVRIAPLGGYVTSLPLGARACVHATRVFTRVLGAYTLTLRHSYYPPCISQFLKLEYLPGCSLPSLILTVHSNTLLAAHAENFQSSCVFCFFFSPLIFFCGTEKSNS